MPSPQDPPAPTVRDQLDAFSHAALKTIATRLGVAVPVDQRVAYLEALTPVIGTPRHREALERRLSQKEWDLLNLLPLRFGPVRLRVLLLAAWEKGAEDSDPLLDTRTLLACGCLLPQVRQWNAARLGIDKGAVSTWGPNAVLQAAPGVSDWARDHLQPHRISPVAGPPEPVAGSALPEFERAAFVLLAEAARKPIRLTVDGTPYKTDMRALASALAGSAGAKKRPASEPLPPLVYFVLTVLHAAGVLVDRDGALRPDTRATELFEASTGERAQTLREGWYQSRFKEFLLIPGLEFGYGVGNDVPWFKQEELDSYYSVRWIGVSVARRCIAAAISDGVALAPDSWYSIDQLARVVYSDFSEMLFPRLNEYGYYSLGQLSSDQRLQHRPYSGVQRKATGPDGWTKKGMAARTLYQDTDWMEVEGGFVRTVLATAMRWLGLVEVGPDATTPDWFRLTELGRHLLCGAPLPETEPVLAGRKAVVQPNYEVIVLDAAHSMRLLAQLDAFAERRTLDRAATYRLTQATLVQGLDNGWTGKRVLATLEAANEGPLPQNVRFSLEEWIRIYESLTLREAAYLLEADDPEQLDAWLADAELAKLLGERVGPTSVRVAARHTKAALERLGRRREHTLVVDYANKPAGAVQVRDPDRIEQSAFKGEPYLRYRLSAFSDLVETTGEALIYRITPASVRRAVEMGWTGQQIRDFLDIAAGGVVSPDVDVRLWGWSGAARAAQAETLVAVVLAEESAGWEWLSAIPSIGTLIRAIPTPALALVAPSDLAGLRSELESRGLSLELATLSEDQLGRRPDLESPDLADDEDVALSVFGGLLGLGGRDKGGTVSQADLVNFLKQLGQSQDRNR